MQTCQPFYCWRLRRTLPYRRTKYSSSGLPYDAWMSLHRSRLKPAVAPICLLSSSSQKKNRNVLLHAWPTGLFWTLPRMRVPVFIITDSISRGWVPVLAAAAEPLPPRLLQSAVLFPPLEVHVFLVHDCECAAVFYSLKLCQKSSRRVRDRKIVAPSCWK